MVEIKKIYKSKKIYNSLLFYYIKFTKLENIEIKKRYDL